MTCGSVEVTVHDEECAERNQDSRIHVQGFEDYYEVDTVDDAVAIVRRELEGLFR